MKFRNKLAVLGVLAGSALPMFATDPDASSIVTAATTGFGLVATLSISIATFAVVLRLVKKFAK